MPLHHNVGRAVSPACLEPNRESLIGHRLGPIDRERRPGHRTTQPLESVPIVSRNGHIGVQAHASLSHTAGWNRSFRFDTPLPAIERLDPIPETPPTLARLGARRDPRAKGRGREQRKQRIVRGQGVLTRIDAPTLENPKDSMRSAGQNARYIFGFRRRKRNERSKIVRRSGIDPVEHECVEMWRQVQRRPEALDESDRPILSTRNP